MPFLPYTSFLFTSFYYFHSLFFPCFLGLFLFFYTLLYFLIPPPCLPISFWFPKCHSQHSSAVFLSIFAVLFTHQIQPILASQNPGHLLFKRFLTACLLPFPPSYIRHYFLCLFLTVRAILHITIRCGFVTQSFTITL